MTRSYCITLALLVLGIVLCCLCIAGPARASTTEDALAVLCPGRESLAPHIDEAARRYLIHPVVLVAVARKESNCRADAIGKAGEVGVMQLRGVARNGLTRRQLLDPRTNVLTGARWLALREVDCGGGLLLGLSGYNARTCQGGKGYARRVLDLVARAWREMAKRREVRS
jgi:soluble lytic murein transglycosylase-like protein